MKPKFIRLDKLIADKKLADSRTLAQEYIAAGRVSVENTIITKPASMVSPDAAIKIDAPEKQWVSRGAHKLLKALDYFAISPKDMLCIDIGASTGGFTDVLLSRGAAKVYAVDVGYGQLDWKLRQDPRVAVMERTNARSLLPEQFPDHPTLTVMDVSFISIKLVLPAAAAIMGEAGRFLTLVKPQFEAGRGQVGKNGVVREAATHERVLREIRDFCPVIGWSVRGFTWSPIKGPKGNIEFLADIRPGAGEPLSDEVITALVSEAHMALRGAEEV